VPLVISDKLDSLMPFTLFWQPALDRLIRSQIGRFVRASPFVG